MDDATLRTASPPAAGGFWYTGAMGSLRRQLGEYGILIAAIALYLALIGGLAAMRHHTFQTQAFDLGVFSQAFWNTLHGRPFVNSLEGGSHFATHFTPFLFLLVPFYAVAPSPYTLLWLQTLALALGAVPLYAMARTFLAKRLAAAIALAYLLYPWLHSVNLFDFHEESFAIPLILTAFYYLSRDRLWPAAACLALAALTKENSALAVAGVGLFLLFASPHKKFGAGVTLAAASYFAAVSQVFLAGRGGDLFRARYGALGSTPADALKTLLTRPALIADTFLAKAKAGYLLRTFAPVAFLPLFAPAIVILLLPGLLQNLLSQSPNQISNLYQYDALVIPFLFIGLVYASRKIIERNWAIGRFLPLMIMILAISSFALLSLAGPARFSSERYAKSERVRVFREFVGRVPPRASVAADTNLVPHLAARQQLYLIGSEPEPADIVIFDRGEPFPFASAEELERYARGLMATNGYDLTTINDRYSFLVRKELAGRE